MGAAIVVLVPKQMADFNMKTFFSKQTFVRNLADDGMKLHDFAFSKVNYSEPIFYPPPRLNHVPFKFTKKTRKLAQAKETQKQYYVSRFNNLMKPKMHFQSMDIGVRIETLFSDRIKELCNGKVCYFDSFVRILDTFHQTYDLT